MPCFPESLNSIFSVHLHQRRPSVRFGANRAQRPPVFTYKATFFVLRRAERKYGFRISASRTAVRVRTRAPLSRPLHRREVARRSADRWAVRFLQNRKAVMPPVAWSG